MGRTLKQSLIPMDPFRHAFFLILFTSLLATEPTQANTMAEHRSNVPSSPAMLKTAQRIALAMRRTDQTPKCLKADPQPTSDRMLASPLVTGPQRLAVHPAFRADTFRLPPPAI